MSLFEKRKNLLFSPSFVDNLKGNSLAGIRFLLGKKTNFSKETVCLQYAKIEVCQPKQAREISYVEKETQWQHAVWPDRQASKASKQERKKERKKDRKEGINS